MTVQNTTVKDIYVGNGATTKFPITFQMTDHPEYIKVYITGDDSVAVETENFSVDLGAKTVTYPANGDPLPDGHKITIYRELPLYQLMNLVNQGPFFAENIELSFDDLTFICQQLNEKLNRTLSAGVDVNNFNNTFPVKAGMSFRINDAGDGLVLTEDPARVLPLAKDVLEQTKQVKESAVNETTNIKNTAIKELTAIKDAAVNETTEIKDEAVAAKNTAVGAAATAAEDAVNNVQTLLDEKVAAAENAKSVAVSSAESALASKNAAAASQSSATASAETAQASAESASSSADAALASENNAKASETKSAKSEENAKAAETAAENSKKSASDSASAASSSAESAKKSETSAAESAESAKKDAEKAEDAADRAEDILLRFENGTITKEFTATDDRWTENNGMWRLTMAMGNSRLIGVYKEVKKPQYEMVLTGVYMDAENVIIEVPEKFAGIVILASLTKKTGDKVYVKNFTEEDFAEVGSDFVLTISAEEHQAGNSPVIVSLTQIIDGVSYPYYANAGVDNNGNVVINVSKAFTGKIILDGGYLE